MIKKPKSINARAQAEAFGAFPESLINAAVSSGIEILNMERVNPNTLRFDLYERDIDAIKEISKKCSLELEIKCYRAEGRRVLKKRFALLPILSFMGILIFVSSLFIWQIDIYGLDSVSRGKVMRALEDSGLRPGTFWPGIEADEIRSRVMLELPEIAWMTVNVSGSRAKVLVNERVDKPEIYKDSKAADLVADKTGLVRRVSVLSGDAAVKPSQAVAAGELLASGRLTSIMGRERSVRARGTVMADTWYEIDAVCPEKMEIKSPGVFTRHRFALVFGKRRINFYFSSGKAIDECDKIIKEYTMGIDGQFALPVRFVHERLVSCDLQPGIGYNRDKMAEHLTALLQRETEGQVLQSVFTESSSDGLYILTLRAHCLENIAVTRELAN